MSAESEDFPEVTCKIGKRASAKYRGKVVDDPKPLERNGLLVALISFSQFRNFDYRNRLVGCVACEVELQKRQVLAIVANVRNDIRDAN